MTPAAKPNIPPLTPRQSLARALANDARNIADCQFASEDKRAIADFAKRLFEARSVDAAVGGRELSGVLGAEATEAGRASCM